MKTALIVVPVFAAIGLAGLARARYKGYCAPEGQIRFIADRRVQAQR